MIRKLLKKINWLNVRVILVLGLVVFLFAFSNKRNNERKIGDIEVVFHDVNDYFVNATDIKNLIEENFPKTSSITRSVVDLNKLESAVNNNVQVKLADLYLTVDNRIIAKVWQKKAIARVVNGEGSYYLDELADKMPLSSHYAARVPVITGPVDILDKESLKNFLLYIKSDEFLAKDIVGVVVHEDQTIELQSRLNTFAILFGDLSELALKLENYKAFTLYSIAEQEKVGEEKKYKKIDLKFTQQVICTK